MENTKRLDLFYDALKDEYKSYVDDVVKSIGFLVVAIGWIMTSDGARAFLTNGQVNTVALACTVVLGACNLVIYIGHYFRSARLKQQILLLDSEASELVANYAIRVVHIVVNSVTMGGFFVLLVLLISSLRR